ncbi:MAG: deoxyribose-phosphate aldolase [Myxococcaceae bacterium]|nr:deoxyribose-phosphate aldolase [Myxococcaceae bacterium]MBH2006586.1 deoxyribose-phosphate aldolase [Myxococcaceae bacterium]
MESHNLAALIDHTCLKPDATEAEIERLCAEALQYGFAAVCVNPYWIPRVSARLGEGLVKPIAVVGFPLGANRTASKAYEAHDAIDKGAREIDMVINLGALKGGDFKAVLEDIESVVHRAAPYPVKVILETCLLDEVEKRLGCQLAVDGGAHFVKTSTGFSTGGSTLEDVRLMREVVGSGYGVKASGGIKSREFALGLLQAGANRLGCSASVALILSEKI